MNRATPVDAGRRAACRRPQWRVFAIAGLTALSACGPSPAPSSSAPAAGGWYEFQGSWIAAGSRRIVSLGGDRRAGIIDLKGSMLLAGPSRPGVGFRAEAIALGDSATGVVGRAVWTDEKGDQAYSEFRGTGNSTGSRIEGTFVGGTGRYAGADGTYEFTWQYVLEAEDGTVQGRAVGLAGRVRFGQPPPAPGAREVKP
jgi:hypothetical protein